VGQSCDGRGRFEKRCRWPTDQAPSALILFALRAVNYLLANRSNVQRCQQCWTTTCWNRFGAGTASRFRRCSAGSGWPATSAIPATRWRRGRSAFNEAQWFSMKFDEGSRHIRRYASRLVVGLCLSCWVAEIAWVDTISTNHSTVHITNCNFQIAIKYFRLC
jgi:hypothetical protein